MIDGEIYNQQIALKKVPLYHYNVTTWHYKKKLCDFQFAHIWGDVGPPPACTNVPDRKKNQKI